MAERKINGRTFSTGTILATKSMVLKARLARTAAPVFAVLPEALGAAAGTEGEKEVAGLKLMAALSELFGKGDPEVIAELFKDICEMASITRSGGETFPVDFDGDLSGDNERDIIPLVAFVLQENFGGFLSGFRAVGNLAKLIKKV